MLFLKETKKKRTKIEGLSTKLIVASSFNILFQAYIWQSDKGSKDECLGSCPSYYSSGSYIHHVCTPDSYFL